MCKIKFDRTDGKSECDCPKLYFIVTEDCKKNMKTLILYQLWHQSLCCLFLIRVLPQQSLGEARCNRERKCCPDFQNIIQMLYWGHIFVCWDKYRKKGSNLYWIFHLLISLTEDSERGNSSQDKEGENIRRKMKKKINQIKGKNLQKPKQLVKKER